MKRWGITVPLEGSGPLHQQRDRFEQMASAGYTDVWTAEAMGLDGLTPLALASTWAPTLRLGTAILPAFTRGPALMAQSVAAMAEAAPGRFTCGIGSSSNVIVEQWNGIEFDRPLQRTRDMVRFLRLALSGEKVSERFDTFTVDGFRLRAQIEHTPRIVVAALRERMLVMAGQEADGAIANWLSPEDATVVSGIVRAENPDAEMIARIFVVPTDDADQARAIGRFAAAAYLNVPVYRRFHEWMGRTEALADHWQRWADGDRKGSLDAIPDEVIDSLIVHGSPARCRAGIERYVEAGIDVPIIAALPVPGLDDAAMIEALAPAPTTTDHKSPQP